MYQKIQSHIPVITFCKEDMRYSFLETGDIYEFGKGYMMVNQFLGNLRDGAISNIYLRLFQKDGEIKLYPLRGKAANAVISKTEDRLVFTSQAEGLDCHLEFIPHNENLWLWKVTLEGEAESCDLVCIQDVGVGDKGAILNNTLYVSQYLDHKIMESEWGYLIGSRQNMSQGGKNPYLQQGCLGKRVVGYATDAMQIYGKESKASHFPEGLKKEMLPNEKYQYELGCTALQTERFGVHGTEVLCFYGYFTEDHPEKTEQPEAENLILTAWEQEKNHAVTQSGQINPMEKLTPLVYTDCLGGNYSSEAFTKEEIEALFPNRSLEEYADDTLLSFFTEQHHHVVLQEKELQMERPHGHIMVSLLPEDRLDKELLTATTYMYGVFCSQLVVGNVDSNPLLTGTKGLLNLHQEYGLRIYVKRNGRYSILAMPAAYEIGLNYTKWYYKLEDDLLCVTTFMTAKANTLVIKTESTKNRTYEFLITMSLALGVGGAEEEAQLKKLAHGISLKPGSNKSSVNYYPDLEYAVTFSDRAVEFSDDRIFYEDGHTRNALLLTAKTEGSFELVMRGKLEQKPFAPETGYERETEEKQYLEDYRAFLGGMELETEVHTREAQRFNESSYWYLHNAFIHYAVPHGLEQSGGAAWGTRDVCQGPMELFLTTGHFALAKDTLLEIFAHQNKRDGEWPQWFMFDKYPYAAGDCHGDVVFWPLKCVGDYIEATKDSAILTEEIPFADGGMATMLEHIKEAVASIRKRYLYDTFLINYAGGDWDDTLQPANRELKEKMCSAWTQALAYQALCTLQSGVAEVDKEFGEALFKDCDGIQRDFNRYLIKDGTIAGFALLHSKDEISYLLHPEDTRTGLHYRLLPLTRSIIAGLATSEQAQKNNKLIDEKLTFPDGVRLMDRPAEYNGGISKNFVRAEQAANVGREISLQYVHAHIRYIESMAKLGEPEKVVQGLLKVNPVCIQDTVKNADLRQSNTYFSSSEGDYKDRYEFRDQFERLREGTIRTKGGWRIYSSGPGIYLSRLIRDMLGIKMEKDQVMLDPAIAPDWDGLTLNYSLWGKEYCFTYHVEAKGCGVKSIRAGEQEAVTVPVEENRYRASGKTVTRSWLESLDTNRIEIYLY